MEFTEKYRNLCGGLKVADDQIEGINFLLKNTGAILAFQTGLGKTLSSLVAARILIESFAERVGSSGGSVDSTDSVKARGAKCVIVCPVKAVKIFRKELHQKLGYKPQEVGVLTSDTLSYNIELNQFFIVSDTCVGKYLEFFSEILDYGYNFVLIIDEAHKLQDSGTKYYQNMLAVRCLSSAVWGLTATPILNDLDSLYNIVDYVSPGYLGNRTAFDNRYLVRHLEEIYVKGGKKRKHWVIDGYKNMKELHDRLEPLIMVRKRHYDLNFANVSAALTDAEFSVYETVSSGIFEDEERNFSRRLHDLQRLVDNSYTDDGIKDLVSQTGMTVTTKETLLMNTLQRVLKTDAAIIIYADYHDTINRLEDVLTRRRQEIGINRIHKITGSVSKKQREAVEDRIQARDIILITSAGSESINLQKANCLIFYDLPYSSKVGVQCIGRICRRDTTHSKQYVILLYTKGTIDEYKYTLFNDNLAMMQAALGIGTDIPVDLNKADRESAKKLRDKLLWVYKNKKGNTKKRKQATLLNTHILTVSPEAHNTLLATHRFVIEPIPCEGGTPTPPLFPDNELYTKYLNKEIPYTVLRASYLNFLRTANGRKLMQSIIDKTLSGDVILLLISQTNLNSVLKSEIIEYFKSL